MDRLSLICVISLWLAVLSILRTNGKLLFNQVFAPLPDQAWVNLAATNSTSVGEALFLTPLIEAGKLAEARSRCAVDGLPGVPKFNSCAGFLTVDKRHNGNMFFWFIPAMVNHVA